MALSTRAVLAIIAGGCMAGGLLAGRRGHEVAASWLVTGGFLAAVAWSGLGIAWAGSHESQLSPTGYLTMATMAVAGAIYFGDRAARGLGPG